MNNSSNNGCLLDFECDHPLSLVIPIVDRIKTENTNPQEVPVREFIYSELSLHRTQSTFRVRCRISNGT